MKHHESWYASRNKEFKKLLLASLHVCKLTLRVDLFGNL